MSQFPHRGRSARDAPAVDTHTVRVDRRTKDLTKRLNPGDIAVIDHADIDRVSAEALVACRPAAVLNAARSTTGRYPNLGPQILLDAGIPHLDGLGPEVMTVREGSAGDLVADSLVVDGEVVATGHRQTAESIEAAQTLARIGLSNQLEAFAANTMEYLKRERALLLDGVGIPDIATPIKGRHVLVVVRGYHYKEDLRALQHYIREYKPILIGVDGGADALLEIGRRPDLIVGDMDSVSDQALQSGAEIVVHAYRDGRAPGLDRVRALGLDPVVFPATGTSEDIAMLLADDAGATLIVAVGTHATLVEFLDKGRAGMASTFLTRLRVGGKLVDAKGVSRLYRTRISIASLLFLVLACLLALVVALATTPGGQAMLQAVGARWDDVISWIWGLFT
ncbi:putative cytokinetic ring protein SteA [Arsenicicoccus sp. oral taxon 190]|uniref:putative cytokinetic ring protein SteA n=1 Tax=Arsenicicoccus sp. oral taxon 190 TaxID=1658671 RepID=UPI00067A1E8F|nr:putative cytokinetic ring protein SteA [Arsenicicoccus sp. oral taxon 190]AKT51683.1 thiamin pyrophosphokinase [Arsenicicoccus sp. oral taxon 190]